MESKPNLPNVSPESQPKRPQLEQQEIITPGHEIEPQISRPEEQPSHYEKKGESQPAAPAADNTTQITLVKPPQPVVPDDDDSQAGDGSDTPTVAADGDNIEKEWVLKAKNIINETKSDPHLQEKRVSRLQADYLQKRYNKKVKLSSD